MLELLKVRDLALIETLEMEWQPGFVAVTGETGAGKSVLLGALALLAGGRADKSLVRVGASQCEIEALLRIEAGRVQVEEILERFGLPSCEDGALIIKRVIPAEKPGRVHINGALATRAALQELGACWIDFHGPGEHQHLLQEASQLILLDAFAGHNDLLQEYHDSHNHWKELGEEIERVRSARKLGADEQEFLRAQIAKIEAVNPTAESIAELEQRFNRAMNQREILEQASALYEAMAGEEGALSCLYPLRAKAEKLASLLPEAAELQQRLSSLMLEMEDLAGEYEAQASHEELDAGTLDELQQSMQQWLDIKRRYGPTPEEVSTSREGFVQQLESQSDIAGTLARLERERSQCETEARRLAQRLQDSRERAGVALCREVNRLLRALGFKSAALKLDYTAQSALREYGLFKPVMMFQSNPGGVPQPLSKIASSGECARVMLAIKTVLAEKDATPVLVFDEVDANVGGEIALEVGRELASLGERHQVLCITHLPQVAAQAASHICVRKESDAERTSVCIEKLDTSGDERVEEIARMLGDRRSDKARAHARELLQLT